VTKIVYNGCFGGFGLSDAAVRRYLQIKGISFVEEVAKEMSFRPVSFRIGTDCMGNGEYFSYYDIERTDPVLAQVVEELGKAASGSCADLCIVDLKPGTKYRITEYDGSEWIETEDDIEWSVA
jgi:hypothetical protein